MADRPVFRDAPEGWNYRTELLDPPDWLDEETLGEAVMLIQSQEEDGCPTTPVVVHLAKLFAWRLESHSAKRSGS
jgi:hypothetical protein